MSETIRVKIADYATLKDEGILVTLGLGSCVGVALFDNTVKVAGLAHILLSDSNAFTFREEVNPGKFANTAIPLLLKQMSCHGARQNRLHAKIAGGSQLFSFQNNQLSVGEKNIRAVRSVLSDLQIPVVGEDVGGNRGRTIRFFVKEGLVIVSTVGGGEKQI